MRFMHLSECEPPSWRDERTDACAQWRSDALSVPGGIFAQAEGDTDIVNGSCTGLLDHCFLCLLPSVPQCTASNVHHSSEVESRALFIAVPCSRTQDCCTWRCFKAMSLTFVRMLAPGRCPTALTKLIYDLDLPSEILTMSSCVLSRQREKPPLTTPYPGEKSRTVVRAFA